MAHKFLITGLPRSRTAWLAALFSTDGVICWHEPINKLATLDAVQYWLDNVKGYSHVGISDSSVGANPTFYINYFYEYPIVVVKRHPLEVIESLIRFLGIKKQEAIKIVNSINEGIKYIAKVRNVLEIDFYSLNDSKVVANVWDYCTNGLPFDLDKCNQFQNLMINQHAAKVISEMDVNNDIKKFKN